MQLKIIMIPMIKYYKEMKMDHQLSLNIHMKNYLLLYTKQPLNIILKIIYYYLNLDHYINYSILNKINKVLIIFQIK